MSAHRTRLGLPVRPGWLVREQVELAPPDGALHVVAHSEPVLGVGTAEFAAGYGQLFADHLSGYEEIDVREAQLFGGRPAVLRRYRQVPSEGAPLSHIASYLVEDGIGHVVTATTTTARFAAVEGDLLGILAQVEIDRGAVVSPGALTVPTRSDRASRTSTDDLSPPWRRADRQAGGATGSTALGELSADELVALAQQVGSDTFPYLDGAEASDATGDHGAAVVRAACRSLLARGLMSSDASGSLAVRDDVRRAIETAVDPTLVVTIELEGDDRALTALAVDGDVFTQVDRREAGVYGVRTSDPGGLLDRIADLTDSAATAAVASGIPAVVPAIAVDRARAFARVGDAEGAMREIGDHPDLLQAVLDARALHRVRSVHRSGDVLLAGELVWLRTGSGTAWVLEPTVDERGVASIVTARPVGREELDAQLSALLP